jgi:ribonuclease P protein component
LVLQARRRAEDGAARVGFTVSRQVGDAVERNRVRRRLREIVRLSDARGLRAGHDYVVVGRRAALAVPFSDMVQEFDTALGRVHGQIHGQTATTARATGGGSADFLHEAGSASRPTRPHGRRRNLHGPQASLPVEPPEFPPQER